MVATPANQGTVWDRETSAREGLSGDPARTRPVTVRRRPGQDLQRVVYAVFHNHKPAPISDGGAIRPQASARQTAASHDAFAGWLVRFPDHL